MTLHQFLFDRLWDRGVRHIYGIPGDFALNLFEALERDGRFTLVRLSHEPAVGFAADGAARMTGGLGVCCVTYGAGGLNMVNPVACAYAEQSPLVVLSGGPGRVEKRAGLHVHHEVKTFESQLNVYREVTEYSAILDDPRTAATHITRAIDVAVKAKRPVYLEIPRDMVTESIDPPLGDARLEMPIDDGRGGRSRGRDRRAACAPPPGPVLIAGVEVHRFQLRDHVVRLAETAEPAGGVVVSRPRRVPDPAPAVRRHLSRRGLAARAARDRGGLRLRAAGRRADQRHQPRHLGATGSPSATC